MSQITTHVLDTSKGKPAEGVKVRLFQQDFEGWSEIASGTTNSDGRIGNLLDHYKVLYTGIYKLRFDTHPYFELSGQKSFYPFVEIVFEVEASEHYHVPLLLNPFGYSTYRGS